MSGQEPVATFDTDPKLVVLDKERPGIALVISTLVTFFTGGLVASALGVGTGLGAAVSFFSTFLVLELFFYVKADRGTVAFYDDRVEYAGDTVKYEDVSAAIRSVTQVQRWFETADYELVVHGDENLDVDYVVDPAGIEPVLESQLPTPSERLQTIDRQRPASRYMDKPVWFWHYWEAEDGDVPESAVVDLSDMGELLSGNMRKANFDKFDSVDMADADSLGDIKETAIGSWKDS